MRASERELPYWLFDAPAPGLFSSRFIGAPTATGAVAFAADNPLQFWSLRSACGSLASPRNG